VAGGHIAAFQRKFLQMLGIVSPNKKRGVKTQNGIVHTPSFPELLEIQMHLVPYEAAKKNKS
jgi:hypothetical protein